MAPQPSSSSSAKPLDLARTLGGDHSEWISFPLVQYRVVNLPFQKQLKREQLEALYIFFDQFWDCLIFEHHTHKYREIFVERKKADKAVMALKLSFPFLKKYGGIYESGFIKRANVYLVNQAEGSRFNNNRNRGGGGGGDRNKRLRQEPKAPSYALHYFDFYNQSDVKGTYTMKRIRKFQTLLEVAKQMPGLCYYFERSDAHLFHADLSEEQTYGFVQETGLRKTEVSAKELVDYTISRQASYSTTANDPTPNDAAAAAALVERPTIENFLEDDTRPVSVIQQVAQEDDLNQDGDDQGLFEPMLITLPPPPVVIRSAPAQANNNNSSNNRRRTENSTKTNNEHRKYINVADLRVESPYFPEDYMFKDSPDYISLGRVMGKLFGYLSIMPDVSPQEKMEILTYFFKAPVTGHILSPKQKDFIRDIYMTKDKAVKLLERVNEKYGNDYPLPSKDDLLNDENDDGKNKAKKNNRREFSWSRLDPVMELCQQEDKIDSFRGYINYMQMNPGYAVCTDAQQKRHDVQVDKSQTTVVHEDGSLDSGFLSQLDLRVEEVLKYEQEQDKKPSFGGSSKREAKIAKLERRLKKLTQERGTLRDKFQEAQQMMSSSAKDYVFIALDLESFEHNHEIITEVGISAVGAIGAYSRGGFNNDDKKKGNNEVLPIPETRKFIKSWHLIPSENRGYRNGEFVRDNRTGFKFGTSQVQPLGHAKRRIQDMISKYQTNMVLVGHAVSNDILYLSKMGVQLPTDCPVIDTSEIWKYIDGPDTKTGLSYIVSKVLPSEPLASVGMHNAGNDAYYTLLTLLTMTNPSTKVMQQLQRQSDKQWNEVYRQVESQLAQERQRGQEEKDHGGSNKGPAPTLEEI